MKHGVYVLLTQPFNDLFIFNS